MADAVFSGGYGVKRSPLSTRQLLTLMQHDLSGWFVALRRFLLSSYDGAYVLTTRPIAIRIV